MKKILLGLTAMSVVSFAAPLDVTKPAAELSNIFQTGQKGKIGVNMTITSSDAPMVKYAVFSADDASFTNPQDTLTLPTLVLSLDTDKMNFKEANTVKRIYIRRVVGDKITDLDVAEVFRLTLSSFDPSYTAINGKGVETVGAGHSLSVTSFFPKAQILDLAKKAYENVADVTNIDMNTYGELIGHFKGSRKVLRFAKQLFVYKPSTSEVHMYLSKNSGVTSSTSFTEEEAKPMFEALKTPISSTFYIDIEIK